MTIKEMSLIRMNDNITILGSICITLILALCIIEYLKSGDVIDTFEGAVAQPAQPVQPEQPAQPLPKSCNSDSDCPIRFKCDAGFCKDIRPGKR
jgi:hypothetical protein